MGKAEGHDPRLKGAVHGDSAESEEELAFHLEALAERLRSGGMGAEEALEAARRRLGDGPRLRRALGREARRARRSAWWDARKSDVRHAFRRLVASPAFTLPALATLALGIGAATAIHSVVDTVLLAPLPYPDAARDAFVWERFRDQGRVGLNQGDVADLKRRLRSADRVAAWTTSTVTLAGDGEPERVPIGFMTYDLLGVLGVRPILGRGILPAEDVPNGPVPLLLSERLWKRRFGGDRAVIGRTLDFGSFSGEVVGVLPADFLLPAELSDIDLLSESDRTELWAPLQVDWGGVDVTKRNNNNLYAVAHLADDASLKALNAELDDVSRAWQDGNVYRKSVFGGLFARSLREETVGPARPALLAVSLAVALLLLAACANVASLLLARGDLRLREIAVRRALGAGRRRVVAQLLTESATLAMVGGVLGSAVAVASVEAVKAWDAGGIPRLDQVHVSGGMLAFSLAIAGGSVLLFGLAPALELAASAHAGRLHETSGRLTGRRRAGRLRSALVVGQVAMAVVLTVGAGLLLRSYEELRGTKLGFEPDGALTAVLSASAQTAPGVDGIVTEYDDVLQAIRAVPGVDAAGAARILPLASEMLGWMVHIEGEPVPEAGSSTGADWQIATPGYLEALGVPLLSGRTFKVSDRADAPLVAVVNRTMARKRWGGADAVGKRFAIGPDAPWITVVGVVGDLRHNGLTRDINEKFYLPHAQFAAAGSGWTPRTMSLVVRSATVPPAELAAAVRHAVWSVAPDMPVSDVRTLGEVVAGAMGRERFVTLVLWTFAAFALVLCLVGVYGVVGYVVAGRTREMALRMALGAQAGQVRALLLVGGLGPALAGVCLGGAMAWGSTRFVGSLLHGVGIHDPLTFGTVSVLVLVLGVGAACPPAWRASRSEPGGLLRQE